MKCPGRRKLPPDPLSLLIVPVHFLPGSGFWEREQDYRQPTHLLETPLKNVDPSWCQQQAQAQASLHSLKENGTAGIETLLGLH